MIEAGNVAGIRPWMEAQQREGCHTMNAVLRVLLAEKKIALEDARHATTDRVGLAARTA
jgi:twitching motility protein PilT